MFLQIGVVFCCLVQTYPLPQVRVLEIGWQSHGQAIPAMPSAI